MINLTFVNPQTNQRLVVDEMDENMCLSEIISNLVEQNFIPLPARGEHYHLVVKGKGEITDSTSDLTTVNIDAGDVVFVNKVMRGGGMLTPETLDLAAKIGIPVATGAVTGRQVG